LERRIGVKKNRVQKVGEVNWNPKNAEWGVPCVEKGNQPIQEKRRCPNGCVWAEDGGGSKPWNLLLFGVCEKSCQRPQ